MPDSIGDGEPSEPSETHSSEAIVSASNAGLGMPEMLLRVSGLTVATVVSGCISAPVGLVVARWLGPSKYGRTELVLLVYFFASLFRTGVFEGGIRQFIHARAMGDQAASERARDVGYSWEVVASALPGLVLLVGAFFMSDGLKALGFALALPATIVSSFSTFFGGIALASDDTRRPAQAMLARTIVASAVVLGGVPLVGPVAVFIGPIFGDLAAIGVYKCGRLAVRASFRFDAVEGRTLFREGFPLGAAAVIYWAYRMVGSLSVSFGRTASAFGLYAFAAGPVVVLTRAVASLEAVLMPRLWREMVIDSSAAWLKRAWRVTLVSTALAGVVVNTAQAGFEPLVSALLPRFYGSVPVFDVLSYDILVFTASAVPVLVLDSAVFNRQRRTLAVWCGALVVNSVVDTILLVGFRGDIAIAWADVGVQLVVVVVFLELAARWAGAASSRLQSYSSMVGLISLSGVIGVALRLIEHHPRSVTSASIMIAGRAAIVVVVWSIVGLRMGHAMRRRPGPESSVL